MEIVITTLFVVVAVGVIGLVTYGIYYLLETVKRPEISEPGVVCSLDFTPAHFIYIYNAATKTSLPHPVSDSWGINVIVYGKELDGMECSQELHDSVKIGDHVLAAIRLGRMSGKKYLFGVTKL